ncbi:hypothetical protein CGMCC3_g12667 [Colletotrichum fructicola]|nr:uncharacterized protein CGMCC3_g12667 [Colletotrichum fructicola]KAE9571359.1 hypothetical protein CGMCC3_g12667 [Colletotrichum fructicola]
MCDVATQPNTRIKDFRTWLSSGLWDINFRNRNKQSFDILA